MPLHVCLDLSAPHPSPPQLHPQQVLAVLRFGSLVSTMLLYCHVVKLKFLSLFKWKDEQGRSQSFCLRDRVSSKWRDFGIHLDLQQNTLDNWHGEFLGNANACWDHVMQAWLERGHRDYPPTWEGLYHLLEDVGFAQVARELKNVVTGRCVAEDSGSEAAAAPSRRRRHCCLL